MPPSKHILINALPIRPGGGLTVVDGIGQGLAASDNKISIILQANDAFSILKERFANQTNVQIHKIPAASGTFRHFLWQNTRLNSWLRSNNVDIVISFNGLSRNGSKNIVYHINLLRFMRNPFEFKLAWLKDYLRNLAADTALKSADRNIFESQYLLDSATNYCKKIANASVAYIGIPDSELAISERAHPENQHQSCALLAVTSPGAHKDNPTLIKAFAHICAGQPSRPWSLSIAGGLNPSVWSDLKTLAAELGVGDKITWLGYVDRNELRSHYTSALCLLSCSLVESFCMTALEAMVHGCPVVVSDSTSMPESVGKAGLLARPSDHLDFANKVLALSGNRDEWQFRSKASQEWARQFTWRRFSDHLIQVIDDL